VYVYKSGEFEVYEVFVYGNKSGEFPKVIRKFNDYERSNNNIQYDEKLCRIFVMHWSNFDRHFECIYEIRDGQHLLQEGKMIKM